MRPLSFENLRRLVGRKKDRNEPSFKRSESFKRISIRKSYLDRGKRRNKLQKSLEPTVAPSIDTKLDEKSIEKQTIINEQKPKKLQDDTLSRESISYDEWLQGVSSSSREKLDEVHREQQQNKQNKQHILGKNNVSKFQKQIEADHVAEDLKVLDLDASPVLPSKPFRISNETIQEKNNHQDILQVQESFIEGPPSVSINLGRIWRDAVPMPFPSSSGPSIHHSLDSALKERKSQPTVARTVSAPEKSVTGKDITSAFGFSLRIAKLADFRAGGTRNGFFNRRTKKPSPSVNAEGYFKRTNASRRSSSRRRGKRTSQRVKKSQPQSQPVARSNSPVWFVPPERRRSKRQRRVWREIRYFPEAEIPVIERIDDYSSNLSDDQFDDLKLLLSGDFNDRREGGLNSLVSSSLGSFSATSSSSSACRAPKISDFNEDKLFSEELRTSGVLARRTIWRPMTSNYFASNQFLSFLSKGSSNLIGKEKTRIDSSLYYRCLSSTDSETEDETTNHLERRKSTHAMHRQQHLKRQRSGLRRRPLRRKSQLRKASGQPVFLVRKCSSLRKRPRDITQKGYEKKRTRLLQQYASKQLAHA